MTNFLERHKAGAYMCPSGLEKLTNANRSVSSVNDRLFPVELTEIADWVSVRIYVTEIADWVSVRIYVTFEFRKKP